MHNNPAISNQDVLAANTEWITKSASLKAETRGNFPGFEPDDCLDTDQGNIEQKIQAYLHVSREDGGLTLPGLRNLAESIGIPNPDKAETELELIRLIQQACHSEPCFRNSHDECCHPQSVCLWRGECRKLIAEYQR